MPWTMTGLAENHVPLAPLPPQTIVTTDAGYSGGKFVPPTSNQYSSMVASSVV